MLVRTIIAAAVGAVVGFGYYKLVGCSSGACPLTSNPYISAAYGAVLGVLLAGAVR